MYYFDEENIDEDSMKFYKVYAQLKGKNGKPLLGPDKKPIRVFCAAFKKRGNVDRWLDEQEVNPYWLVKCGIQNSVFKCKSTKSEITEEDYASLKEYCEGKMLCLDDNAIDMVVRRFARKSSKTDMLL